MCVFLHLCSHCSELSCTASLNLGVCFSFLYQCCVFPGRYKKNLVLLFYQSLDLIFSILSEMQMLCSSFPSSLRCLWQRCVALDLTGARRPGKMLSGSLLFLTWELHKTLIGLLILISGVLTSGFLILPMIFKCCFYLYDYISFVTIPLPLFFSF